MGKKTEKLTQGLKALNWDFDQRLPNVVVYGELAKRGYRWNGHAWALINPAYRDELEIRVSSKNGDDVMDCIDSLACDFHERGHHVRANPPIRRESGMWQGYIRITE